MGSVLDKIVGPDMVAVFRTLANTGTVIEPEPAPFRLSLRNLQPFTPPDALDAFVVHRPTILPQQRGDPPIPITAIAPGQVNHCRCQRRLILTPHWRSSLDGSMLPKDQTGATFRDTQVALDGLYTSAATLRA
jgi:hypothetical protein